MDKNDAQIVDALMNRIDGLNAKIAERGVRIERAKWALYVARIDAEYLEESERDAVLKTIDFIEKCMEG